MSAADAGRKKVEDREAQYVAVGDRILDPNGREYTVKGFNAVAVWVVLDLQPLGQCGDRSITFLATEPIRVRVRQ